MLGQKITQTISAATLAATILVCGITALYGQPRSPLTYPELMTALQTKVPNSAFQTKEALVAWVIKQIRTRKVDKPLTKDREEDLRQAGAPDPMIAAIRESSPQPLISNEPVDLGELAGQATNLVRPEYTEEARRTRTQGNVKLALELDEQGRVTSVARLVVLENGLTDRAVEAARRSTFRPAMRDGKPARGKGILSFNFKLDLIDTAAVLAAANGYRERRECDLAIAEYDRILKVDPKHAQALLGRGTCRLSFAQYDVAVADMSAAVASEPNNEEGYLFLAIAQDFQGDHLKAASNYQKAIAMKPDLDKQDFLKCLYIDRGQMTPAQARAAAERIIAACDAVGKAASDIVRPMISYKRGIGYRLRSDHDKAIAEFENLKRSAPRFTAVNSQLQVAYNGRGLESFEKKDYRKALEDVTLAIKADPGSSTPYVNRCAIYAFGLKQYSDAINDCSYAIRLSARSSSAFNYRGYANEMMKNRDAAIADYTKALELDSSNDSARSNLNRLQPAKPTMKEN